MAPYECDLQIHSVSSDENDANEKIRLSNLRTNGERLPMISVSSDYHVGGKKGVRRPSEFGKDGIIFDYFRAKPLLVVVTLKNSEE